MASTFSTNQSSNLLANVPLRLSLYVFNVFTRLRTYAPAQRATHFPIVRGLYIVFCVFLRMRTEWNGMSGFPPMQIQVMGG
jgi:hypothetical protein